MFTYTRGSSAFSNSTRRGYVPRGIPDQEKTAYSMVFDPSGTIRVGAEFTRNDVRIGAELGAWEDGVIFLRIRSGKQMAWSAERGFHTPGAQVNRYARK